MITCDDCPYYHEWVERHGFDDGRYEHWAECELGFENENECNAEDIEE